MHKNFKMLDLFSGIGGFSYAASKFGIETVGFAEIDHFCSQVLKKHWPYVVNYGDVRNVDITDHVHLITGGFPCQPFSIAGKQKGKDDERYLWPEFLRIIKQAQPCWVIAENVTGIISLELDNILADLEAQKYATETFVLPACAANAAHRRDRLWIIAHRPSLRCDHCQHNRQRGHFQVDEKWHVTQVQQKWEELKPITWQVNTAKDWFAFNTRASRATDGLSARMDRIKSLGNAIVPQIAAVLIGLVYHLETSPDGNFYAS